MPAAPRPTPVQLRCLSVSPDGRHLAAGDALGNVRVYDLASSALLHCKEAHDGEVTCLDYCLCLPAQPSSSSRSHTTAAAGTTGSTGNGAGRWVGSVQGGTSGAQQQQQQQARLLLACGSRDMLIHVLDAGRGYELAATCEEHDAAVTAVRWAGGGCGGTCLVSCGADKSVVFRCVPAGKRGEVGALAGGVVKGPGVMLPCLGRCSNR